MNNVVLVGRLTDDPKLVTTDNGKKITTVNIAVSRNYKNSEGIYETDFIRCVLWNAVACNTSEYCHVGDVVGIKGRLQTSNYTDDDGEKHFITEVIAERVTFLSSSKAKEENEEDTSEVENKNTKKAKKGK